MLLYPEKGPEASKLYNISVFGMHLKEWCERQKAVEDGVKPKKNEKMEIQTVSGAGWENLVFNESL